MDLIFKCSRRKKKLKKPSPSPEEGKAKVWRTFARHKTRAMLAVTGDGFSLPKPVEQDQSYGDAPAKPHAQQ